MLVSYKWLKNWWTLMFHHKNWLKKMSTTGIEVEGVESPAAGLSKNCRR